MSRRIPPTPVAAPWKGSTALGWLCDSTLNAHASPPPTSTAPAFSPGPMTTCGPSVGSVRNSFFECLYAQCSLHSSEYIASSSTFGGPPCFSQTSSYSCSVSPSASASATVGSVALADISRGRPSLRAAWPCRRSYGGGLDSDADRLKDLQPVRRAARQLLDRVLGVRHQAEHVARLVADAGDVVDRAVEVLPRRIAQDDL